MKRIIYIVALCFMALHANAQSTYDVIPLFNPELSGTARFVGMGGAMSALGGDMSVMSTNPAGIGIYRSNDFAATASMNLLSTEADFRGSKLSKDNTNFSFDNLGLVFSGDFGGDALKFVNLGIGYTRRNNFRKDFAMNGWYDDGLYSQQYQMSDLHYNSGVDLEHINCYSYINPRNPWLPLLAANTGVLNTNGEPMYLPTDACYYSEERGGVNELDFNLSFNINDRLYLGMTLGMQYIDYNRYSIYSEYDDIGVIYDLESRLKTEGSGFDVKLGAIVRPFEYSPFRLGLAFHLPTYYSLTEYSNAYMAGPYDEEGKYKEMSTLWDAAYGEDYIVDYCVRSPWRMNLSAGYTFDNILAVNAEYELVDYSSTYMEYEDGTEMIDMNDEFNANMKTQHIFRAGAELRLDDNLSMRCGYNYISSAFKDDAWKYLTPYSASTSTEYMNTAKTNIVTLGLGYRGKSFYFDAAYQCAMHDAKFYTYYDSVEDLPAADVSTLSNKLIFTVGMRF
ncbi:MAG: hypothetical protein IKU35_09320 [Bacteroidaceae bacterium]|nr:hypothetical protein [Bacteroidaceae bacterium]MBR5891595.1 hypothetical protein [Bacteroidaceae bacterium]